MLAIQQLNCQHLYILQISIHVGSVIGVGQMLANQLTPIKVTIPVLDMHRFVCVQCACDDDFLNVSKLPTSRSS